RSACGHGRCAVTASAFGLRLRDAAELCSTPVIDIGYGASWMSGRNLGRIAAALLGTALLAASLFTASAAAMTLGPLGLTSPVSIPAAAPYGNILQIDNVSCPSASVCVAADDAGGVVS